MVVSKRLLPWYDERIHDGIMGRQLHMEHMHSAGLGFVVHPHAFLMKQPVLDKLLQPASEEALHADVSYTPWQSVPLLHCCCVEFTYSMVRGHSIHANQHVSSHQDHFSNCVSCKSKAQAMWYYVSCRDHEQVDILDCRL